MTQIKRSYAVYESKHVKLKNISPLVAYFFRVFITFNVLFGGVLLIGAGRTNQLFIVTDLFDFVFWGALFLMLGIGQAVAYFFNSFAYMRALLTVGLTLQFFWVLALIVRQVEGYSTNALLLVFFVIIAIFKLGVYLYFPNSRRAD